MREQLLVALWALQAMALCAVEGVIVSAPKSINESGCECQISFPCACTDEEELLTVKLIGSGGTKKYTVVLVECPTPPQEKQAEGPRFVPRLTGPRESPKKIKCGEERHYLVWTGTKPGMFSVFLRDADGNCFECAQICIFDRTGTLKTGFANKSYRCPPQQGDPQGQSGPGINIPGDEGGTLFDSFMDDCGNKASFWCHESSFKMMFESSLALGGKVGECIYGPGSPKPYSDWGQNRHELYTSKCGEKEMIVRITFVNQDGAPDSNGKYHYCLYEYTRCKPQLKFQFYETTRPPLPWKNKPPGVRNGERVGPENGTEVGPAYDSPAPLGVNDAPNNNERF